MALQSKEIENLLTEELKKSFVSKGHSLNGKFESTIRNVVIQQTDSIIINGYYAQYGNYLDKGVSPDKIPYNPNVRSGAGKSQYIEGLRKYVQYRMHISGREGLGIAFAIAKRQKQKGMSLRFAKRGSFFVDEFLKEVKPKLRTKIEKMIGKELEILINQNR